jgi:hypothetical protein
MTSDMAPTIAAAEREDHRRPWWSISLASIVAAPKSTDAGYLESIP